MTEEDRLKLEAQYSKAIKRAANAHKKVNQLREMLSCGCAHPEGFVTDYHWEHDNGYGRQTKYVGKQCTICRALDHWNRGRFIPLNECIP